MEERMEQLSFDGGQAVEETKKQVYNRPAYKGISEALERLLEEKDRTINQLKRENEMLKSSLRAFIGGN